MGWARCGFFSVNRVAGTKGGPGAGVSRKRIPCLKFVSGKDLGMFDGARNNSR